jgi:hypothetical protein
MPKVQAFNLAGLDLVFYTSPEHDPPHFHTKKPGHWEIRVYFLECQPDWLEYDVVFDKTRKGLSKADEKRLRDEVVGHMYDLLLEWENTRPQ